MIDTHCHLTEFDVFRLPEIIQNAQQNGIQHLISVSAAFDDWAKNQIISQQYPQVSPAFGIHPKFRQNLPDDWQEILGTCLKSVPQAIVGEIGLDFYHSPNEQQKQQQMDLLRQQLHIAQEYHRPISLHCVKAHQECIALIKKHKFNCGGFIHGFSGSLNIALEWIKLGFVIGIGTVLLKTNSTLRKIFAQLPANAWVLESDAPFMLPENTPAVIQQIAHTAAQLSQQSLVSIQQQSTQNTVQFLKRCEW